MDQNEIIFANRQFKLAISQYRSGRLSETRARQRVAELRAKYGSILPQPKPAAISRPFYCDDCGEKTVNGTCPNLAIHKTNRTCRGFYTCPAV